MGSGMDVWLSSVCVGGGGLSVAWLCCAGVGCVVWLKPKRADPVYAIEIPSRGVSKRSLLGPFVKEDNSLYAHLAIMNF